jgi:predicted transcriptional regulator
MENELRRLKKNVIRNWDKRIRDSSYSILSLAKKAKVSRATIYNAINRTRIPHAKTINRIEDLLIEDEERNGK